MKCENCGQKCYTVSCKYCSGEHCQLCRFCEMHDCPFSKAEIEKDMHKLAKKFKEKKQLIDT